jgi:hypothetical protein
MQMLFGSHMRTSDILHQLQTMPAESTDVAAILAILGDRSFALLVVFLGLPNCIPMPPPIPLVSALVLMSVAVQMIYGAPLLWLPRRVAGARLAQKDVARVAGRALPVVAFIEKWSVTRLQWMPPRLAGVVMGALLFVMAWCIVLAAPIIGQIPFGIAVCCIGLGLVERDGVIVLCGTLIGALGLFLSASFAYAVLKGMQSMF